MAGLPHVQEVHVVEENEIVAPKLFLDEPGEGLFQFERVFAILFGNEIAKIEISAAGFLPEVLEEGRFSPTSATPKIKNRACAQAMFQSVVRFALGGREIVR